MNSNAENVVERQRKHPKEVPHDVIDMSNKAVLCALWFAAVVFFFVPRGLGLVSRSQVEHVHNQRVNFIHLEAKQQSLLMRIAELQVKTAELKEVSKLLQFRVQAMNNLPSSTGNDNDVIEGMQSIFALLGWSNTSHRVAGIDENHALLTADITQLKSASAAAAKRFTEIVDTHAKRFIVKFHKGGHVKTSKRFAEELEAETEFERVGDFAKKLLMYDSTISKWIVLRSYGGDEWLAKMSNDDTDSM